MPIYRGAGGSGDATADSTSEALLIRTLVDGADADAAAAAASATAAANSMITKVVSITSASTITPNTDTAEQYQVTALATNATIATPAGTPLNAKKLLLRIKDNGTARTLTWTTSAGGYRVIGTSLPSVTTPNKTLYVGCIYNLSDSFWDVVAVVNQV